MNEFISQRNGGAPGDVPPPPPAAAGSSPAVNPVSDNMMKEIAKDCVRLKKELAKKEAQISHIKSASKMDAVNSNLSASSTRDGRLSTPATGEIDASAPKHIPGTARFNSTRTPNLNAKPAPPPPSAEPVSAKKKFPNNPNLQRSSTHVLYAAMGLPEESDRFDTPGSSISASMSDASVYMYHNPPLSTASNPNENTPKSNPNPRHLSFSTSAYRPKNRSKLASFQLNHTPQTSRPRVAPKLGYTRTPQNKAASLNIFKSSRCSTKSTKIENSKEGRNEFDGTRWKSTKSVNTAATKLFKSRFTDNATTAWGKEAYSLFYN